MSIDLGISPGRYRRGEWVYTCTDCGREGELEWMHEHLKLAHGLKGAKEREEVLRVLPKRRECVNIREVGGETSGRIESMRVKGGRLVVRVTGSNTDELVRVEVPTGMPSLILDSDEIQKIGFFFSGPSMGYLLIRVRGRPTPIRVPENVKFQEAEDL